MSRYTEEDLIAYHLGEPCDAAGIREALEQDRALAELSESIGLTLRVFSADPVPKTDVAKAWDRLRATLPSMEAPPRRIVSLLQTRWVRGLALGVATFAMLLVAILYRQHTLQQADQSVALRQLRKPGMQMQDQQVAQHLDRAERWLTEVSHTSQPPNPAARAAAQSLLLNNALYVRTARERGDLPDAALLERLGRVLTAADHEQAANGSGWHVRLEMNTDGLLLDIRILRQNQAHRIGDTQ